MQLAFGSGAIWGERTDVTGTLIGPQQFGILQDVMIDFEWTDKPLYGQQQFPVVIGRGQGKISGTAKFAQIVGRLYSDIFFGTIATVATGQFAIAQNEAGTVPATPYQITVANAATFADDLGVFYAATGLRFKRVTSSPTVGQYSVNLTTGVYTFAAADTTVAVLISYAWNNTTTGSKLTLSNQLMGYIPTFKATFYQTYTGPYDGVQKQETLRLNACTSHKLSLPTKIDDWMISEMTFTAASDAAGVIGSLSTYE